MALRFVPGGLQSVAPSGSKQAIKNTLTPSRGGGGGSSSSGARARAAAAEAARQAQIAAEQEAARKAAQAELARKVTEEAARREAVAKQSAIKTQTIQSFAAQKSSQSYIQPEVVDTFNYGGRKNIPVTKLYVNEGGVKRVATPEEQRYYNEQTNVLVASEKKKPGVFGRANSKYNVIKGKVSSGLDRTGIGFILNPVDESKYAGPTGSKVLGATIGLTRFPQINEISILGATQTGTNPTITDVIYTSGKKRGGASGVTFSKPYDNAQLSLTKVVGKNVGSKNVYTGYDVAVSTQGAEKITGSTNLYSVTAEPSITKSFSLGKTINQGKTSNYMGFGVGFENNQFLATSGITKVNGGSITSKGFFKLTEKTPTTIFSPSGSSVYANMPKLSLTNPQALQSVQQAISSSQPAFSLELTPRAFPGVLSPPRVTQEVITKKVYSSPVSISSQELERVTPKATQITSTQTRQRGGSASRSSQALKQKDTQITSLSSALGLSQSQRQPIALASALSQRQAQQQKQKIFQIQKQKLISARPILPIPVIPKGGGFFGYKTKKSILPRYSRGLYNVQVRRFGKFRSVGSTYDLNKAIGLGESKVRGGLGATFKITGGGKIRTPRGFYRKLSKKEGQLFIQKNKYRLSSSGEKGEIKFFQGLKAKPKKMKGGKKKRK